MICEISRRWDSFFPLYAVKEGETQRGCDDRIKFRVYTPPSCFEAPSPTSQLVAPPPAVLTCPDLVSTLVKPSPEFLGTWGSEKEFCHSWDELDRPPGGRGSHAVNVFHAAIFESIWRIDDLNSCYVVPEYVHGHKRSCRWLPPVNSHTWTFRSRRWECLPTRRLVYLLCSQENIKCCLEVVPLHYICSHGLAGRVCGKRACPRGKGKRRSRVWVCFFVQRWIWKLSIFTVWSTR